MNRLKIEEEKLFFKKQVEMIRELLKQVIEDNNSVKSLDKKDSLVVGIAEYFNNVISTKINKES
jgi:hypothetical protein